MHMRELGIIINQKEVMQHEMGCRLEGEIAYNDLYVTPFPEGYEESPYVFDDTHKRKQLERLQEEEEALDEIQEVEDGDNNDSDPVSYAPSVSILNRRRSTLRGTSAGLNAAYTPVDPSIVGSRRSSVASTRRASVVASRRASNVTDFPNFATSSAVCSFPQGTLSLILIPDRSDLCHDHRTIKPLPWKNPRSFLTNVRR